jgi:CBS domain-containing protein
MPYPVENLIEGRAKPTTVRPADSAQEALALMIDHDYSQLPVVDESDRPLGMITYGSMLQALNNFSSKLEALRVSNAIAKADRYRLEDDLSDVLDRLKETNAVLIVDGAGRLIGIVTSYDSTEYFRRRAEDMMLVEDIEGMVRDLIEAAFKDAAGDVDAERLAAAIDDVTNRTRALRARYQKALRDYLKSRGDEKPQIDLQCLRDSFSHLAPPEKVRSFEELSLSEFVELLLHPSQWALYQPFFDLAREDLRTLLEGVRDTRNMLAHFRGEISPSQRDQLRFCANWLAQHPAEQLMEHAQGVPVSWPVHTTPTEQGQRRVAEGVGTYAAPTETDVPTVLAEEELGPADSRYATLAICLQSQPADEDRIQFSFQQIEEIIGGSLPASARTHRSWWANDSVSHVHSQQWLDVGWRVAQINMTEETVTFARIKERENDYIRFFSSLLSDMRETTEFHLRELSPDGQSWHVAAKLPEHAPKSLQFVFAFSRGRRFRVELYIDTGDKERNKVIFDQLYAKRDSIHEIIGEQISWERLNEARSCRIAWYRPGVITNNEETLREVRAWAVSAMVRFYGALAGPSEQALSAAGESGA